MCAATSTTWEVSGFPDFLKGEFSGVSLTSDGLLALGPAKRFDATLDQPAVWSLAAASDGGIYAATGHQGKVFRVSATGKASIVWTAEQPEVFAICTDASGTLFAGSSPNGGLYRIASGKATEIWHSTAKYIWALQAANNGDLYVATGEPANIYVIHSNGNAELYYETGQSNVTALAAGRNGHIYAGTEPNGLLYDISSAKHATVLLDSKLPEIRAIVPDPSGAVYVAAMGGSVASRTAGATTPIGSATSAVVATTPTVITVTEAEQSSTPAQQSPIKPPAADQTRGTALSSGTSGGSTSTSVVEVSGVDKSAIYRIAADGTLETLRTSKEDNVYDLSVEGQQITFSTDVRGRVYQLRGTQTTLLAEAGGEATRLLRSGDVLYVGTSTAGHVIALTTARNAAGSYESQVHDATSVARWGHFQWHGSGPGVAFRTRTGNAARVDSTWSPWSEPITESGKQLITSPAARFIQWRVEWPAGSTAQIDAVDVPYLPQNSPPVVRSVTVTSILGSSAAKTTSGGSTSTGAYSITVTDTGDAPAASSATSGSQTVSRLQTTQTQISWQADDADGDKLVYSVYFRAETEKEWQLIRSRMFENTLLLDPDVLADGRYFFRVVASDAPSNAPEYAREAALISTPVIIDNTPPAVEIGTPVRSGTSLDVDVEVRDATSTLRLCEYSLDAGLWQPIEAADGITDSPQERFHLHLDKLRPGEHLLVFRVYDSANNAGLAKVVLH